jgi:hypothetical protein
VVECDRHAPVIVLDDHHRVVRADGGAASRGYPKARDELCDLVAADKYRDQIGARRERPSGVDAALDTSLAETFPGEGLSQWFRDIHINAGRHGYTISSCASRG